MSKEQRPLIPQSAKVEGVRRFVVSSSPHSLSDVNTRSIMLDVILALLPALGMAVYFYGARALMLTAVSVAACISFEWLYRWLLKKPSSVHDLSAVVTGILIAFNLPASSPYWVVVLAAAFAIVIVKQLYGGIGKNFMNPALASRVFVAVSFAGSGILSNFTDVYNRLSASDVGDVVSAATDAVSSATPLQSLQKGVLPDYSMTELLLGQHSGSLGEVSALVLLIGGLYLVLRKVISPRIPLCYLGTVAVLTFLFPLGGIEPMQWMMAHMLSGGLVLGAIFMATDYATSPVTRRGQMLFGIGCGALTVFLRYYGSYPEGVSFAVLIMNACVWLLDKAGKPRRFGRKAYGEGGGEQ